MKQLQSSDLEKLSHNFQVSFAVFCAKQVLHLVDAKDKQVCENAILTAEKWLIGTASSEDCKAAAYAANAANAAAHAAYAAAHTANTAAAAAHASKDKQQTIKEQNDYYNELLNFDKNFEEIVLT